LFRCTAKWIETAEAALERSCPIVTEDLDLAQNRQDYEGKKSKQGSSHAKKQALAGFDQRDGALHAAASVRLI